MTILDGLAALGALAFTLSGTALIYRAWRQKQKNRAFLIALGWALALGGCAVWVIGFGPDQGIAFALLGLPFMAWLCVSLSVERKTTKTADKTRQNPVGPALSHQPLWLITLRRIYIVLLAGPLSLLAACGGILGLFALLGTSGVNGADQLATTLFLAPVLWGVFAVISVLDAALWRRTLGVILPAILGLALAFAFQSHALQGVSS